MNIQPEIICAAGVPGLLPDLLALPVLPVMKYFIEGIWIQIFSLRSSLQEQWQWEWICLGRKLDAFCSFPQELEGMLLQSSLLHGQLALFQLYLESLTPTENSLCFEGCGNFPIRLNSSLFVSKNH